MRKGFFILFDLRFSKMAPHTAKNKGAFAFADFYNENANPLLVQLSFDNFAINW